MKKLKVTKKSNFDSKRDMLLFHNELRRIKGINGLRKRSRRNVVLQSIAHEVAEKFRSKGVALYDNTKVKITMPRIMDLDDNYEETSNRILSIRRAIKNNYRIKKVFFDDIEFISPAAALLLAAEIDKWNQLSKVKLRAEISRWKDSIRKLLCQMGYFELLGLNRPVECPYDEDTTFMPFIRGEIGVNDGGALAKSLRVCIEDHLGEEINKDSLYAGLSEAIVNVSHHAYGEERGIRRKQWWATASFKRSVRRLNVVFYDQGDGIPYTLPRVKWFEHIKEKFNIWNDAEKIQAAMKHGRSSVLSPERGKGLMNLTEFAKYSQNGKLMIMSLRGEFQIQYSGEQEVKSDLHVHESTIGGTLIEWVIYV